MWAGRRNSFGIFNEKPQVRHTEQNIKVLSEHGRLWTHEIIWNRSEKIEQEQWETPNSLSVTLRHYHLKTGFCTQTCVYWRKTSSSIRFSPGETLSSNLHYLRLCLYQNQGILIA